MSIKTLANRVTGKVGRQMLVAQKHSPVMLFGAGIVGVTATAVLACRATLKLSAVLDEAEQLVEGVDEQGKTPFGEDTEGFQETVNKAKISIKLQTAITIAKLYAPAVAIGIISVGALTGSHVILSRRNAAVTMAYGIMHKSFDEYRGRVIKDQGTEKDLEYRFGTVEREIVEEGPNGPEVKVIKGLDQDAVKKAEEQSYSRVFDRTNPNYSTLQHQNQYFIQMVQNHARDALEVQGYIFLCDVYDMLGIKRTAASMVVGWVKQPRFHRVTGEQLNDCYVDFGTWEEGMYKGKQWVNGDPKAFMLDFNVDGMVLDILDKV